MSIEKFLNKINIPNSPAGPFKARLSYELKQKFVKNTGKEKYWFYLSLTSAMLFFIFSITLLVKPDLADKIHYVFNNNDHQLDVLLENGHDFATNRNNYTPIKDLSHLDESKSYVVRRIKGRNNKNLYYVSEFNNKKIKIAY